MAKVEVATGQHNFEVVGIARVEGEGTLRLRITDGEVREARLSIFEAPRYFEKLVVGRTPNEVVDIVARICGICPIAYQMGASMAFEHLFEVEIDPQVRALRKLLYWGEWIESHALHVYMLHAPDFLGYESAIAMARDHKPVVEQALRLKRTGNEIMKLIGGRAIHPVAMRVGGLSRTPTREQIAAMREPLGEALALSQATLKLVATFKAPKFERDPLYVAIKHPVEYGLNEGRIVSSDGIDVPLWGWREAFHEEQHEGTNALHARTTDGRTYMLGPSARVTLNADQLHPLAREALKTSGLAGQIASNPYWAIAARSVELIHASASALDIVNTYEEPVRAFTPWTPRPGETGWGTEAPRGICWHHYDVDEAGRVAAAQIIAPTGQNQGMIEQDLAEFAPRVLSLPHAKATVRLEQLIRSYDPCISCATHFLKLEIDRD
ncbi:MAG: nickel-dependent hydrogenase large subunit [Candidatus Limnocylindrales bacterium]|jgi:coenzyme F420-reducing hydrogenase alpha subunit